LVSFRTDVVIIAKSKCRLIHTARIRHTTVVCAVLPIITGNFITHTLGSHTGIQICAGIAIITFDQKVPDGKMAPLHLRRGRITKRTDLPFDPYPILIADIPDQAGILLDGIKASSKTVTLVGRTLPFIITCVGHSNAGPFRITHVSICAGLAVVTGVSLFADLRWWNPCIFDKGILKGRGNVGLDRVFYIQLLGHIPIGSTRVFIARDAVIRTTPEKKEGQT